MGGLGGLTACGAAGGVRDTVSRRSPDSPPHSLLTASSDDRRRAGLTRGGPGGAPDVLHDEAPQGADHLPVDRERGGRAGAPVDSLPDLLPDIVVRDAVQHSLHGGLAGGRSDAQRGVAVLDCEAVGADVGAVIGVVHVSLDLGGLAGGVVHVGVLLRQFVLCEQLAVREDQVCARRVEQVPDDRQLHLGGCHERPQGADDVLDCVQKSHEAPS